MYRVKCTSCSREYESAKLPKSCVYCEGKLLSFSFEEGFDTARITKTIQWVNNTANELLILGSELIHLGHYLNSEDIEKLGYDCHATMRKLKFDFKDVLAILKKHKITLD